MAMISVIVPVYNAEKYLHSCIDSILRQSFKDFEIMLIDDGSKDGSSAICDEYAAKDSRIRVFHKPNGGVSSARNLGLDNARGEWVTFVDSDDWIAPTFLELLLESANKNHADICMCDFYFSFRDNDYRHDVYSWRHQGVQGLAEYIESTWTIACASIQKRSLYEDNRFRFPLNIRYCEDFHLIIRLCSKAKIVSKVNEPLYYYRQQEGSVMHNLNKETEADERWAYSDMIDYLKSEGLFFPEMQKVMSWRCLKASQELVLDSATFEEFKAYRPLKKQYIMSCPYIGMKLKVMMWCVTHQCEPIARLIVGTRHFLRR